MRAEASQEAAVEVGRKLVAPRSEGDAPRLCGLAVFPEAAASAAELMAAAHDAALMATEADPVNEAPADLARTWRAESSLDGSLRFDGAFTGGAAMQRLFEMVPKLARSPAPASRVA